MAMGCHCEKIIGTFRNFIEYFRLRFSASDDNMGCNTLCLQFAAITFQCGESFLVKVTLLIEGVGVNNMEEMQGGIKLTSKG